MRLTLRTLLAYLDEIPLPPEEVESLRARIEESEFAQGLIQRIRSVLGRLRLSAPRVDAKSTGIEANTVAEYLDNTLPPDRVADFERICLESDVQLAEVAACHQILALVVSEPAQVPATLREKIYQLPDTYAEQPAGPLVPAAGKQETSSSAKPATDFHSETASVARSAVGSASGDAKPRPRIPDYLRAARREAWRKWLATAALVAVLITAALMALGRMDETHPILSPLFKAASGGSTAHQRSVAIADATRQANRQDSMSASLPQTPSDAASTGIGQPSGNSQTAPDTSSTAADKSDRLDPSAPATEARAEEPAEARAPTAPSEPVDAVPRSSATPSSANQLPAESVPAPEKPMPAVPDMPREPDPSPMPAASQPIEIPTPVPTSPLPNEVGRFLPGERRQVLARFDAAQELWFRVPERELLKAQERLLVLPSYRPQLAFSSGVQALLVGPCHVQLLGVEPGKRAGMAIHWGAVLFDTAGVSGASLTLKLAGHDGTLEFLTPDATLAIEVARSVPRGRDPAVLGSVGAARLVATSGRFAWKESDQTAVMWQFGEELHLIDGMTPALQKSALVPQWVKEPLLRDIDLRASRELEPLLEPQKPVHIALQEQLAHRQVEVVALATHCLVYIGRLEPAVAALNNERLSLYWRTLIDAVRQMAIDEPRVASELQQVLKHQRPQDEAVLYRLFWGFNDEQLQAGDAQRLVQMLEHPALDVRVLAFDNLQRITGKTFLYRPERDPSLQRRPLQEWRTALSKGEIRWTNPAAIPQPAPSP